jgi:hypothetical protein
MGKKFGNEEGSSEFSEIDREGNIESMPSENSVDSDEPRKDSNKKKEPTKSEKKVVVKNLSQNTEGFRLSKGQEYRIEPGQEVELDSIFEDHPTLKLLESNKVISVKRS